MFNIQTWKEIIKDNKLPFLAMTLIFTIFLNKVSDKGLTYLLNVNNQTIYTYNYSLGMFGLILVIPAAIFSIWIIQGLIKFKERFIPPPVEEKLKAICSFSFSLLVKVTKGLGVVVLFVVKALVGLFFSFIKSMSPSSGRGGGGGFLPSKGPSSRGSTDSRKKLKSEAQRQARQKQKEADYAWKHAKKQAQYNMNTTHFTNRVNRANAMQREANEAAKRARNL